MPFASVYPKLRSVYFAAGLINLKAGSINLIAGSADPDAHIPRSFICLNIKAGSPQAGWKSSLWQKTGMRFWLFTFSNGSFLPQDVTVRYGVMPIGGPAAREQVLADHWLLAAVPVRPEDLPCVFSTRRRTRQLDFNLDDSGKTLYVCGCYQNPRDETGPWCAIQSRLIP
ncbi:MAG: hypothetical protein LBD55_04010 [Treponema sp.]|jgi:hypothetical protein|nr:hypothetical protein [Treponema sp.]